MNNTLLWVIVAVVVAAIAGVVVVAVFADSTTTVATLAVVTSIVAPVIMGLLNYLKTSESQVKSDQRVQEVKDAVKESTEKVIDTVIAPDKK